MLRRVAFEVTALLAATGALAGFAVAQFLPRSYVSTATVAFEGSLSNDRCAAAAAQTLSAESLTPIVLQSAYYKPELDFTPVDEVVERIENNASIHSVRTAGRDGFRVEFTDPDRYAVLEVARVLVDEMGHNTGQTTRMIEPIRAGRTGPGAGLCILIGMASGLALGFATTALAQRTRADIS
jgi:hypothetical protein